LTFAPGETNKTLQIPVRGDRLGELDESFFVTLSGARGAKIGDGQGLVTITGPACWTDSLNRWAVYSRSMRVAIYAV
jgi:hypothetical protein